MTAIQKAFDAGMFQHRAEIEAFIAWMLARGSLNTVLEIGAHRGGTSVLFCELGARVISVDLPDGPWGGLSGVESLLRGQHLRTQYAKQFTDILGDSQSPDTLYRVLCALGNTQVDLLFIDGDHSFDGVQSDHQMYRDTVRTGGVIAFHDILESEYHTKSKVDVPRFWRGLAGEKREFVMDNTWGGIGALVV